MLLFTFSGKKSATLRGSCAKNESQQNTVGVCHQVLLTGDSLSVISYVAATVTSLIIYNKVFFTAL